MDDRKLTISIYLLRQQAVEAFDKALRGPHELPLAAPYEGIFLSMPSPGGPPPWVQAVTSILNPPELDVVDSQSPGGLLVVQRSGRVFVVNFGYAWMQLEDVWLERDFGRRVALNSIAKDSLLEIRAEQIFAKGHIANERAPRASGVREFGVEFDRDLVSAIEGKSSVESFGKTIRGATSLRIQIAFPGELLAALDEAFVQFGSNAYAADYPEIANITEVLDPTLISALDAELDSGFASGQAQKTLTLFTPGLKGGEVISADSYVLGRMSKNPVYRPYLMIDSWLSLLSKEHKAPSVASARDTAVHVFYPPPVPSRDYSVYDCIGYDLSFGGRQYVLSSSVWYEVQANFLSQITTALVNIPLPPHALPLWNGTDGEPAYNENCGKVAGLLSCDAKTLQYGGHQSKFEFCDIVHLESRSLFFVKLVSKSQGMSHLVEQVRSTTRLLFNSDGTYRAELEKLFEKYHPNADRSWLSTRPTNGRWHLCLISLGKDKTDLPFFAKMSLVALHKYLDERGHKMSFAKV